ncbi:MAG TPA: hypothetical protein PK323_05580 [Bacteroidia bacterium]|nr:hypothetical protein [Bacteroidia bacterium]
MLSLTEEQIAFIEKDIRVRGITSSDLSIDLLDHICCLIEEELDEYRNFETVYEKTLLLFGDQGLKEIQEETNRLLIFKHYYFMNSTMKISGYISSMMILIGAFFKFQHWLGANILILSGVFFMTVLFLPLLFILKFKSTEENNRSVVLSIIGFVSSVLISSGVLFRVLHWPGARMMTIIGCVLLVFAYLPIYILSVYKNTTNKINATATIILIIAGAGLFIVESGTGLSKTVSDSFWRGVTESNDLMVYNTKVSENTYQVMLNKCVNDSIKTENIKKLKEASDHLFQFTSKMKANLISITEGISIEKAEKINLDELRSSGWNNILTERLLSDEYASFDFTAKKLKQKIEDYKEFVGSMSKNADLSRLNTNQVLVYGEQVNWEKSNFENLPLPLVVFNLIRIELDIKSTELAVLNQVQ